MSQGFVIYNKKKKEGRKERKKEKKERERERERERKSEKEKRRLAICFYWGAARCCSAGGLKMFPPVYFRISGPENTRALNTF